MFLIWENELFSRGKKSDKITTLCVKFIQMKKVLHEHTPLLKMLHKKTNQSSHKKINKVNSYRKNQHRDSKSEITLGQIGTKQKAES